MDQKLRTQIRLLPRRPGVYLYKNRFDQVLYVGKALNLYARGLSYLDPQVPTKTRLLLDQATHIDHIETGSEFLALILEANLIKAHRPKYNIVFRDDKSYLYVFISIGETYPKIFTTRKPKINTQKWEMYENWRGQYFGPFPSSTSIKRILRYLRRIFPYCQQKTLGTRACFYSHIGLCDPCPGNIIKVSDSVKQKQLTRSYRQNVLAIKRIFAGKYPLVVTQLEKGMKRAASENQFEMAAQFRDQLMSLKRLTEKTDISGFLTNPNFYSEQQHLAIDELKNLLLPYFPKLKTLGKIEGYDISNFGGQHAVGAQTVFVHGVPEPKLYRRYRIKLPPRPNDVAMMREMLIRRLKHPDWIYPELVVVDGGKPQVGAIIDLFKSLKVDLPIIGLAKREEEVVIQTAADWEILTLPRRSLALLLLQKLRDETHRFAVSYHRKRRSLTWKR
ncbi:hypothetical protein A3A59_05640 [Candidatus Gottesmanbacteria bacterium RIFCSPLOWO2_01_FULL_42_10]|nr:MAG: hypothetical protein A3A59_05640 [Candidatus Gottesmanbacteria bacterium RIFCSPLOWO2_01_FULL_42_10]